MTALSANDLNEVSGGKRRVDWGNVAIGAGKGAIAGAGLGAYVCMFGAPLACAGGGAVVGAGIGGWDAYRNERHG